ncbi:putative DNA modification/repair radical SAM protein [Bacteriovorax sp. PP10]|uniref:DNA modification/repair radical SAM protein n=1 Tax=Bacteriovorax antarcticus TaxID=3088717 RepID=A0ABU5VX81_9BACT|nr:putative DNA modification/repair radical SAM protein [Bacteriovorax sp. PP10]MEA9357669.1 putative DNA modification/repair radical SAM protein [Bacteriovorax sp. PP10]
MELKDKISILADAAKYDASCASSGVKRAAEKGGIGSLEGSGICHSYTPDGRCISLLKILLTNICIYDCSYCVNRVSSQVKRAKFTVEEVVNLTMNFYKRNYIEGLFLSSGVARSSDETMEEMIEIARRLRVDHKFGGYIHLKAVAGCSQELLNKAGLYADRMSANIELPKQTDLNELAPAKTHTEIEKSMEQIQDRIVENKEEHKLFKLAPLFTPGGQSTQMIVGATKSSDRDIMTKASNLYGNYNLKRVYYSAFSPIPDASPDLPSSRPPMIREHRLYQTDWLLRFYGFNVDEVLPADVPELDLEMDPKLSWAIRNRASFPVDLNVATRDILLRIPGLGVRNVDKILATRKFQKIRLTDLSKMRVHLDKIRPFVVTQDYNPPVTQLDSLHFAKHFRPEVHVQLDLFSSLPVSVTGEF